MSLLDLVQQHLGQSEIQQISQQIGADPAQTRTAVQAAVPMLVGGAASTAQQPGGATEIQQVISSHAGLLGSLGNLAGGTGGLGALLGGGGPADSGGLLGRILGGHQQTVQQGVQQASGLDAAQTKRLLITLAPIVMALLAKRHANASHAELQNGLQQDAKEAKAQADRSSPQVGGLLGKILSHVETPRA